MNATVTHDRYSSVAGVADSTAVAIALVVIGSAALRFYRLGVPSLTHDEAWWLAFAQHRWDAIAMFAASAEPYGALWFSILHLWSGAGTDETALRLLPAMMGVVAVVSVYALGARMFNPRVGMLAAAMLAVHTTHLEMSQTLRAYSMLTLASALSLLCFVRALDRNRIRDWILYVLATTFAVYAHVFALALVPAQAVAVATRRDSSIRSRFVLSAIAIVIKCAPLIALSLRSEVGQHDWIAGVSVSSALRVFDSLAGASGQHGTVATLMRTIYFGGGLLAIVQFARRRLIADRPSWIVAISGYVAPIALGVAISLVRPMMVPEYFLVALPCLLIAVAALVETVSPRALFYPIGAAILALGLRADFNYLSRPDPENWRLASYQVTRMVQEGDAIVFYPRSARVPFDYARERIAPRQRFPETIFPVWDDLYRVGGFSYTGDRGIDPAPETLLESTGDSHWRVWLIIRGTWHSSSEAHDIESITAALTRRRAKIDERSFDGAIGVRVILFGGWQEAHPTR